MSHKVMNCRGGAPAPPAWDSVCVIVNTGRPIKITVTRQRVKNMFVTLLFNLFCQGRSNFILLGSVSIIAICNGRSGLPSYRKMHPRGRRRGPAPTKYHFMNYMAAWRLANLRYRNFTDSLTA